MLVPLPPNRRVRVSGTKGVLEGTHDGGTVWYLIREFHLSDLPIEFIDTETGLHVLLEFDFTQPVSTRDGKLATNLARKVDRKIIGGLRQGENAFTPQEWYPDGRWFHDRDSNIDLVLAPSVAAKAIKREAARPVSPAATVHKIDAEHPLVPGDKVFSSGEGHGEVEQLFTVASIRAGAELWNAWADSGEPLNRGANDCVARIAHAPAAKAEPLSDNPVSRALADGAAHAEAYRQWAGLPPVDSSRLTPAEQAARDLLDYMDTINRQADNHVVTSKNGTVFSLDAVMLKVADLAAAAQRAQRAEMGRVAAKSEPFPPESALPFYTDQQVEAECERRKQLPRNQVKIRRMELETWEDSDMGSHFRKALASFEEVVRQHERDLSTQEGTGRG